MRILIVEDDITSRMLLQELLKQFGTPHVAANGQEAVDAVRLSHDEGQPYDLICLDIMMPEKDGQQALKEIRAQEEALDIFSTSGAKIVMTTAMNDLASVSKAYNSLSDAYLVKPIDRVKLMATLRELHLIPDEE